MLWAKNQCPLSIILFANETFNCGYPVSSPLLYIKHIWGGKLMNIFMPWVHGSQGVCPDLVEKSWPWTRYGY